MKTVYLIGAGMGNPDTLTIQARKALESCDLLLGAARLLEPYGELPIPQKPLVLAKELEEEIHATSAQTIGVLLSGDPGFYSGAKNLYDRLGDCRVITLPGLSSVNYFCARIQKSWQEARLLSVHGRDCDAVGQVQTHEACLFLTGGKTKAGDLCRQLTRAGYGDLNVWVGERLSYPDERIVQGTAGQLADQDFLDLSVMLVENPSPVPQGYRVAAIPDSDFIRGKIPMTKQNIRLAVLDRLHLPEGGVIWDVGAGTGSVAVSCALTVRRGRVFAIEQKPQGTELILQNSVRFGTTNLQVIQGVAPEACKDLPAPDCVFIGGSGGQMAGIFRAVLEKNREARVVLTAISLEGLTEGLQCMAEFDMKDVSVCQITVANTKEVGSHHLMTGENPVWILSAGGKEEYK